MSDTVRALLFPVAVAIIFAVGAPASAQPGGDTWLGPDKAMHFGLSAGISAGGYAVGAVFWEDYPPRLLLGAGITLSLGIAKELFDLTGAGDASWKDLAWDVIGLATGLVVAFLLDLGVHLTRTRARERTEALTPGFRMSF